MVEDTARQELRISLLKMVSDLERAITLAESAKHRDLTVKLKTALTETRRLLSTS